MSCFSRSFSCARAPIRKTIIHREVQENKESPAEKQILREVLRAYDKSKFGPWHGPFTVDEFKAFIKEVPLKDRCNFGRFDG